MKKLLLILLCLPIIGFGQGWTQTFGAAYYDEGRSVQQTTDGGYIITGYRMAANLTRNVYLIKTDGNGIEQWNKSFGSPIYNFYGNSVQQTTDGGYIIAGFTESLGAGGDVYLIKTDGNGIQLWEAWLPNTNTTEADVGSSVQQTTDGGYIITGWTMSFSNLTWPKQNVYLVKVSSNGYKMWEKDFGEAWNDDDIGSSVQQTTDGGYIIAGSTQSFGNGSGDVYLIKTDGSGDSLWTKTFGGGANDGGSSVQQTTDGGYIITGWTMSFGNGFSDVYLIKTDGSGTEQWSKTFGGGANDVGSSVQQTTDGGYIIVGNSVMSTSNASGESDVYLIKTDGNGNVTSTFNIPINPNRKLQKTVDILGKETKPQTNTPLIEIYDDGSTEKKIIIE